MFPFFRCVYRVLYTEENEEKRTKKNSEKKQKTKNKDETFGFAHKLKIAFSISRGVRRTFPQEREYKKKME